MCFETGCKDANVLGSFRGSIGACKKHLDELMTELSSKTFQGKKAVDLDHALAYILMCDEKLVMHSMDTLNKYMSGWDVQQRGLSKALRVWEMRCWFPDTDVTPVQALSGPAFLKYLRLGCVLKDPGAGVTHGQFTHRLQWFALSQAMTNNFSVPIAAPFTYSPLQLYCSYGHLGGRLWTTTFDLMNGDGDLRFRCPDRLDTAIGMSDTTPTLTHNINTRRTKRITEFFEGFERIQEEQTMQQGYGLEPLVTTTDPLLDSSGVPKYEYEDLANLIDNEMYKPGTVHIDPKTKMKTKAPVLHKMAAMMRGVRSHLTEKLATKHITLPSNSAAYEAKPLPTPEEVQGRITASQTGFDPAATPFEQEVQARYRVVSTYVAAPPPPPPPPDQPRPRSASAPIPPPTFNRPRSNSF